MTEYQLRHPEKAKWPEDQPHHSLLAIFKDAIFVIAALLALLAVWGWQQNADAQDKALAQQEVTQKYIGLLASAMNGSSIYDNASGTAYFFDRPAVVKLED